MGDRFSFLYVLEKHPNFGTRIPSVWCRSLHSLPQAPLGRFMAVRSKSGDEQDPKEEKTEPNQL